MAEPRYLFVPAEELVAVSPERRVKWRASQGTDTAPARVAWRLLGGNNHELGRSVLAYQSLDDCLRVVAWLQANLGTSQVVVAPSPLTSRWGWKLAIDGEDIAASGRWYQREREARYNLDQFMESAPSARIVASLGSRSRLRPTFVSSRARAEAASLGSADLEPPTRIAGAS